MYEKETDNSVKYIDINLKKNFKTIKRETKIHRMASSSLIAIHRNSRCLTVSKYTLTHESASNSQ